MTFEENFPSLKDKTIRRMDLSKEGAFIHENDIIKLIEESCLDKKRVKEAIEKIRFISKESYDLLSNELRLD